MSSHPSLDDLIRAQRRTVGLNPKQHAQNRARLLARVLAGGAAATVASAGTAAALPSKTSAAFAGSWLVRLGVTALLASGAGATYFATRSTPTPAVAQAVPGAPARVVTSPPRVAEIQPAPPDPSAPDVVQPVSPLVNAPPAARHSSSASPATSASSSLAAEVQLMHDVDAALRSGQPQRALALLDQHRGDGMLIEERAVAHIVTLCQLGRADAARQEAARFLHDRPRSPLAGRVRNTCAKPPQTAAPKTAQ